ncbi:MAG: type I restriction endonuclease [Myxococcota bacterium]
MSVAERLKALAQRIPKTVELLETEGATKNALVMPFIQALGYDVFNPEEVVPEFVADVGIKKGEKVDYAIKRNGEVIMILEAKPFGSDLSLSHSSQLFRYFTVTTARIGILTNGRVYRFFTDIDAPNKMDERPFLEIDLLDLRENLLAELRKLTKESFDLDDMLSAASELKYMQEVRRILERQMSAPEEEFVRFFFSRAYPSGRFTQANREQFTTIVQRAFQQFISDRVGERLRYALEREDRTSEAPTPSAGAAQADAAASDDEAERGIVTTEEELEGYRIVKAIVCKVVPSDRIAHRDAKSYFAILLDDNNRKPICRLYFNTSNKYIGLLDADKNVVREPLERLEDIYRFEVQLRETVQRYLEPVEEKMAGE